MVITFTILGEPKGKQRPKFTTIAGHARAVTPKQTVSYENLVKMEYHAQTRAHYFPDNAPIFALIDCFMQPPQSTTNKKLSQMLAHILRPIKKPDWDNAGKIICDSLNTIAYHDDAQIVDSRVRKFWSQHPRVVVTLSDQELDFNKYKPKEEKPHE